MQDKEDFENYQNGCEALRGASIDDPIWFTDLTDVIQYERNTPTEKRSKIVEIIMEIDAVYEIGNWRSQTMEDKDEKDDDESEDDNERIQMTEYSLSRNGMYATWKKTKLAQLSEEEEDPMAEEEALKMESDYLREQEAIELFERNKMEESLKSNDRVFMTEQEMIEFYDRWILEEELKMKMEEEEEEDDMLDWYELQREFRMETFRQNMREYME